MTRRISHRNPATIRLRGRGPSPAVERLLRDFAEASFPNPLGSAERNERVLKGIDALVRLEPDGRKVFVAEVRALRPRQGVGTRAMQFLTDLADKHGVQLALFPHPFGTAQMEVGALVNFYRRFGFQYADEDGEAGDEMVRFPRESNPRRRVRRNPHPQTETAAFKRWFGASKVVDAEGNPLVVYHGTAAEKEFKAFRARAGAHLGFHFGTPQAAEEKLKNDTKGWAERKASLRGSPPTQMATDEMRAAARERYRAEEARIRSERHPIERAIRERTHIDLASLLVAHGGDVDAAVAEFHALLEKQRNDPSAKSTAEEARRLAELEGAYQANEAWFWPFFDYRRPNERVIPVYLSIQNPLRMRDTNWGDAETIKAANRELRLLGRTVAQIRKEIEDRGFDGIVYENDVEDSGSTSWIAFEPAQIKSATGNRGTFDPEDPNIMHNPRRHKSPSASAPVVLYHGTFNDFVPSILRDGLTPSVGWGGANTEGVFLSGTPEGAQYWGRYAAANNLDLDKDGDADFGGDAERYARAFPNLPHITLLKVTVPASHLHNLRADMEQAEDVGFEGKPTDWRGSLKAIGDVMYAGSIPAGWLEVVQAQSSSVLSAKKAAEARTALWAYNVMAREGRQVSESVHESARTFSLKREGATTADVAPLMAWYGEVMRENPRRRAAPRRALRLVRPPRRVVRRNGLGMERSVTPSPAVAAFVKEWNARDMDTVFADMGVRVDVGLEGGDYIELEMIEALRPGRGNGGRALRALLDLVDKHNLGVTLTAMPFHRYDAEGNPLPGLDDLVRIYQRFGFRLEEGLEDEDEDEEPESYYMARPPRR
jgi:GNAT superfamily N-acetyltransferase